MMRSTRHTSNSSHSQLVSWRTTILWPLYTTTCVSWHPQLRTEGFCCSKVLVPPCPCWWHLARSDEEEDAGVLLGVTSTASVYPFTNQEEKMHASMSVWCALPHQILSWSMHCVTSVGQVTPVFTAFWNSTFCHLASLNKVAHACTNHPVLFVSDVAVFVLKGDV